MRSNPASAARQPSAVAACAEGPAPITPPTRRPPPGGACAATGRSTHAPRRAPPGAGSRRGRTVEIGDRAGDATDPVVAAAGEPLAFDLGSQQRPGVGGDRRPAVEQLAVQLGVQSPTPLDGDVTSLGDARRDHCARLASAGIEQLVDGRSLHGDAEVEAVEERPREPADVAHPGHVVALARSRCAAAARAWVGGGDEEEAGRHDGMAAGPGHTDDAFLQWFTQRVEHRGRELAELVEEQDATVSEADLARSQRGRAASDQRDDRAGVVRRPERRSGHQSTSRHGHAGRRVDHRRRQRVGPAEGRQDAGQALRQHRLARAGRSDQQQMVAACRGDLQGLPGYGLPAHVGQIGRRWGVVADRTGRARQATASPS